MGIYITCFKRRTIMQKLPRLIGFDRIFDEIFSAFPDIKYQSEVSKFPPFDILKTDENNTEIHFAVAGYSKDDINIELSNNVLSVSGNIKTETNDDEITYSYRGIAKRSFTQKFTISDTTEIMEPELNNGILVIKLRTEPPKVPEPKRILIK